MNTVCHSVLDFRPKPIFASLDVSKYIVKKLRAERVKYILFPADTRIIQA